jgi:hypothetical protein
MQWLLLFFVLLVVAILAYLLILTIIERLRRKDPIWSGGFLANCTSACDSPYICTEGFCLLPNGSECSTAFDCASSLCSGVCVESTSGQIGSPCPCNYPAICVGNLCLAGPGANCSNNTDCANNYCRNGTCANGYPDGFIGCDTNAQCASNSCVSGICNNGTPVGLPGSPCSCDIANVVKCGSGMDCDCSSNLCVVPNGTLFSTCDSTHTCTPGLECVGGNCSFPPNPVSPSDGVCQKNFTYKNGTCRSNTGFSCRTNDDCNASSCGSYVMYLYQENSVTQLTTPPYITTKLSNDKGTLTAVTSNGVYRYNGSWNYFLPNSVDGHTLVDVAFGGSMYVGLFTDGYLYSSTGSIWVYSARVMNGSTLLTNGKYLESNVDGNLLLVTTNQMVYESTGGSFTGDLLYSSYGVSTPVNSLYYTAPVRYYQSGIVNPNGALPSMCPADFRYNNIINCPNSSNYAFLAQNGSLFYEGSFSGIVQPQNNTLVGIDFAFDNDVGGFGLVAILFPTGIYIGKDNVGSTAPGYFTADSTVAVVGKNVYVITRACA